MKTGTYVLHNGHVISYEDYLEEITKYGRE